MQHYPASPAQQRLWIVQQEEPESPAYNLPTTFTVDPAASLAAVEAAFAIVVARHESLRTTFAGESEPQQVVHSEVPIQIDDWDLRGLPEAARSVERERRFAEQRRTPMRLDAAPLWRAALLREDDASARLCLVIHHSVCDAWSLNVIQEDMRACLAGRADELPSPEPYRAYAHRQLEWLAGAEGAEAVAYWSDQLAGAPVESTLPGDRPRPETPTGRGGAYTFAFPERLHEQVRAFARQHRASAHHVLFAALATLVHRCTGAEDLVLGSSVSGREGSDAERVVGMFVNALAVRLRPTAATPFSALVAEARDAVLDGLEHQQVPFDRVVAEVAPQRESGRNPLYQIGFNQVPAADVQRSTGTAKFDLLFEVGDELSGRVEYSAELYDEGTVEAFVAVWFALIEDAIAHPNRVLGVLRTTSGSTAQEVVAAPDPAPSMLERVRRWVAQTPDAVAVEDHTGNQLTYHALWQRAGALAADLKARGAGPDDRVLVLTSATVETAVAVLGVLRAAAAYVCLDPAAPMARLRTVADDSGAFLAVCSAGHRRLAEALDVAVVDVPAEAGQDAGGATPAGDALAYVVYTSGSTGRPKGVGVTHANLAAYLRGLEKLLDQRPGEGYLLAQPLTYDFGLTMFFGALASGSRLVLADPERVLEVGYLEDVVARHAVDHFKLTPSHLGSLVAEEPERLSRLAPRRTLVLGGEASSYDAVRGWRAALPGCAVVNHYGPTETTVGVVALAGDVAPASGGRTTPIGFPLAGVTVEVLDDALVPVAPGVAGQLAVGGPQVARGYLGDPAATAAAFVPDPAAPGARRYLTGDRVRRLPGSGALEFLGRTDDQIKVRGYRVETNEVRSALLAAPDVDDAAVVLGDDGALHGFVAGQSPAAAPDSNRLRSRLLRSLPEYMVPTTLHVVAALPLAAHGKVDRRALLDSLTASATAAPATPGGTGAGVLDVVTEAFAQILERDQVASDDDFFALGGHSLLAIRLVALLRRSLEVALPVRAAFEHSTPQALAKRISELRGAGAVEPLRPRTDDGPARASFGQERLWLMERTDGADGSYNTHFQLTLTGPLAVSALRGALDEVAARHDALRTGLELTDDGIVQVVAGRVTVPVERVDLREIAPDERDEHLARLLEQHARARFDLTAPPLLRVLLARMDDSVHEALFSAHHAVFDGSSVARFVDDLLTAYAALRRGQPATLAPLPVQYADFADWQRTVVADDDGPLQAYWRDHLEGFGGQLSMPTDRVPPARRDSAGAHALFDLDRDHTQQLRELAREETATLTMVLLAAYFTALWLHSGDDDLAVGLPHTARDDSDLDELIGFFVNTLVVRCELSPELTFRELVGRVRSATVGAYEHAALPFEVLVTSRDDRRDPSTTPLVQATFMLAEDTRAEAREAEGLRAEFAPYAPPLARYDLSTWLWLRGDGMHGAIQYRSDLFDAARLEAFAATYAELLAAAVADPDAALGSLIAAPAALSAPADVASISWQPGPIADATTDLTADDVTKLLDELTTAAAAGPAEVAVDLGAGWGRAVAIAAVLDARRWALLDGAPASISAPARIGADAAGRPVSVPWSGDGDPDGGDGGGVVWADGTRMATSLLAAMLTAAAGRHVHHGGAHAVVSATGATGAAGLVASLWPLTAGVPSVHVAGLADLEGAGAATAYLSAAVAEHVTALDGSLRSVDIEVDPDGAGLGDAWRSAVPGAEVHELVGTGVLTGVVARTDRGRPTAPADVPGPEGAVSELIVGGLPSGLAVSRLGEDVRVLGRVATAQRRGGRRVHLGEVAAAVAEHAGPCRVELRGDEVVAHVDGGLDPDALRATLLDNVAAPWVPDGFALATAPPTQVPATTGDTTTDLTARLMAIWAEVLERDDFGPDDDFFALGGHSLLAIRIASRVEAMLDDEFDVTLVFEHPTVAGLAEALGSAGHGAVSAPETEQPTTELEGPASFGQARFWVLDEVTPSSAHNCALVLELDEQPDAEVLRVALADVVRRHAALRTRLEDRAGEVVQVVQPHAELPLDLATVGSADALADLLDEFLARPVPLHEAPQGRALLVSGAPEAAAVLALCIHHAATDAWSMNLITRDLLAALDARQRGTDLPARLTEEPPTTYLQHATRQRTEAGGDIGDMAAADGPDWKYWSERLTNLEPVNLPTDLPRPEVRSTAGDHVPLEVPASLTSRLRAFAAEERLSAFMVGLAAYAVLLSRCGGRRELVIGVPSSGRNRRELEGEVGYFLNTLPIRVTWPEGAAFRDIVALVRREVLGALAHAQLPFEALAARFAPSRELGVTPLVQTLFSLDEDGFGDASASAESGVRRRNWPNGGAKFDLSVLLTADGDALRGSLEYRTDICSQARAEELGAWWLSLLDHCLAAPDRPVELLPTTTTATSDTALPTVVGGVSVGGGGVVDVGGMGEVVGRVWEPVRAGLAGRLRAAGVGVAGAGERVVGVLMERGPGLVEAVHAVVGAGGVYVPLEPSFPDEHLGFLLADAGCMAVVTEPGSASRVRALVEQFCPGSAVLVHAAGEVPGGAEPVAEPSVVGGDGLAYVIHTSGSTGRPKGVGVSHRAVANRLWWMRDLVGITADDRVLLKTPFSFDVSVWELFLPAYVGAVQLVAGPGVHRDSAALVELIATERVSVVHFVPSMLDAFLAEPALTSATEQERSARWGELRLVVCSGEALTPALVARVGELLPWVEVVNLYGPTEAAVDVTWHRTEAGESSVPIGVAVPHTRIEVLDEGLQRVPVGVAGELCIAGVQVARGYVGRPGLTARSFVPDPYGTAGARMYRTGDRARITSAGTVEFLGRSDGQVKVRGVRVELGEVRASLERDPWVRAAWVTHRPGGDGGSLTGYLVPDESGVVRSPQQWRDHLGERLPAHMVPTRIVELDQLPVTVNGKLDTAALAKLVESDATIPDGGGPPQTATEVAVAQVWADLLVPGRPLTVADNFFDLGGHSILALKVVARLRASGYALTLRQVFEHQRLGALAARLESAEPSASDPEAATAADEAPFELLSTADRDVLSALFPSEENNQ